jgi:hypothetical protein
MDFYVSGAALHYQTLSSQTVESLPLVLDGRMHRWDLFYTSSKLLEHRLYIVDANLYCAFRAKLTLGIGRGRGFTELTHGTISLARIDQVGRKLGRFTKAYREHADGERVEAAGMTRLIGFEQETSSLQCLVGTDATGFIEQQDTVDIPKAPGFASTATH